MLFDYRYHNWNDLSFLTCNIQLSINRILRHKSDICWQNIAGPFSKTAVNYSAGAKTAMSNVVMACCIALTLLFLAPLFSYTPLVALSAIIMSAMFGLINYSEIIHLFKVDKFDFFICAAAFSGVVFISMTVGLMLSVSIIATDYGKNK